MIDRAASVLFSFRSGRPRMSLGEIASSASLPPSTVRRLLVQLSGAGLIDQDEETSLYSLSLRFVGLGAVAMETVDMVQLARPVLQTLTEEIREAAFLGRLEPQGIVYLSVLQPPVAIRVSTRAGEVRPVHVTSIGKTLLAHLSEDDLDRWLADHPLQRITPSAITDADALRAELARIRERGFGTNYQESSEEFASVAAPVRDHRQQVVAAIAVSGPAYRISREDLPGLGQQVITAAHRLSERLGNTSA